MNFRFKKITKIPSESWRKGSRCTCPEYLTWALAEPASHSSVLSFPPAVRALSERRGGVSTFSGEHRAVLRVRSGARRWLVWCSARPRGQRTSNGTSKTNKTAAAEAVIFNTLRRHPLALLCCCGVVLTVHARGIACLLFSGVAVTPGSVSGMRDVLTDAQKQTQLISPLCVELGAGEYKFSALSPRKIIHQGSEKTLVIGMDDEL